MESLHRSSSPANPLNFITIILSSDIKPSTIKIPHKFTEKNCRSMQDKVTLKVPNGDIWQVGLKRSKGGESWFDNGWMEFAKCYDLKLGNLLMFKYEGCSSFRVFIYDPSACEIVYPKKLDSCKEVEFDDFMTCSSQDEDQETDIKITGECSSTKRVNRDERRRELEAAKANFKSSKPFFIRRILSNHIEGRSGVQIPKEFIKKHWSGFKIDQKCVLMLGSKTWETTTCVDALKVGDGGWKMFVKDNDLSIYDFCVFELIDNHKNLLKVSILRAQPSMIYGVFSSSFIKEKEMKGK